jgi:hypothetical protein
VPLIIFFIIRDIYNCLLRASLKNGCASPFVMPPFEFSETQKRIALSILDSAKSADELVKEFNLSHSEVMSELKGLLKLKLVSQSGYPPKYLLKKDVGEAVIKRKEIAEKDPFRIRLNIIIEAQAVEESILVKKMKEIAAALKNEKNYTVYSSNLAKTVKSGNYYSTYLDMSLSVKDFTTLVNLMYFYGPVSVEVVKPEKLELTAAELQDGLGVMAGMIQSYNNSILKLMTRQELDTFYKKLYSPQK